MNARRLDFISGISKARRLLAYDPKVSVEEGVRRFWQWYQQVVLE